MIFEKLSIDGPLIIKPTRIKDKRGYFQESLRLDKLESFLGYKIVFCQENDSFSKKNVFRGLHYQISPFDQVKLVKVVRGKILDVIVDLRKESPTFGKHLKISLSDSNNKQLFVPSGFAHGFLTKSNKTIVSYKVNNFYSFDHDRSLNILDPKLNIKLNISNAHISKKDKNAPFLDELNLMNNDI